MGYASKQDLIDRFGETELMQLTDRASDVDAINDTVLNQALADTDAEVDGYLVGRYALPLAATPRILVGLASDIARYRLYADRATEQVTKRYDDAVKFLRSVSRGEISLGRDPSNQVAVESGGPAYTAPDRVFTRDNLKDYAG